MNNTLPKKIVDFARQTKKYKASALWTNKIETEVLATNSLLPYITGVYPVLLSMLGDCEDALIRFYPDGTSVETVCLDTKLPLTQVIAVIGPSIFTSGVFEVLFEKKQLKYQPDTLTEAVNVAFMLHWVLNIEYNAGVLNFMTFIGRFVVGLQNVKRRKSVTKSKVTTLISELQCVAAEVDLQSQ